MAQLAPRGLRCARPRSRGIRGCSASRWRCRWRPALLFSIVPALQASRVVAAAMPCNRADDGGRRTRPADARRAGRLQVAVALVLLVGAGLMLRTLANLRAIDVGFRTDHLLTLRTTLPVARYSDPASSGWRSYDGSSGACAPLPGVEAGGLHLGAALHDAEATRRTSRSRAACRRTGEPTTRCTASARQRLPADDRRAAGRGPPLDERDDGERPAAVVINETMARRYWPTRRRSAIAVGSAPATRRCARSSAWSRTSTSAATSWR